LGGEGRCGLAFRDGGRVRTKGEKPRYKEERTKNKSADHGRKEPMKKEKKKISLSKRTQKKTKGSLKLKGMSFYQRWAGRGGRKKIHGSLGMGWLGRELGVRKKARLVARTGKKKRTQGQKKPP